jgi:heme-degrading monooxygenase HmoA
VSYWSSLEAIRDWKAHAEHQVAQARGRSDWYQRFALRVCRVESNREFDSESEVRGV